MICDFGLEPTGPVEPDGPGLGATKKTRLLNGSDQVMGIGPQVGSEHRETRPKTNPLPILILGINYSNKNLGVRLYIMSS